MDDYRDWFIREFDEFVESSGTEGSELAKSRDAVAQLYATEVEAGAMDRWQTDLVNEGRDLFDAFVQPERTRRKAALRESIQYMLDALHDETILGRDDPTLHIAYLLGDGRDKAFFCWSAGDLRGATMERYRNAAAVTDAAKTFDLDYAHPLIEEMQRRGASIVGDLT